MRINFFCDVDGTLLPFGKGLPESALRAIEKVQSLGHRVFVATGRSKKEMDPRLSSIKFDGGVYSAGATVEYKDEVIFSKRMTSDEISFLFDYAKRNDFLCLIQADDATYMTEEAYSFFIDSMKKYIGGVIDVPSFKIYKTFPREHISVCKFLLLSKNGSGDRLRVDLKNSFQVVDNTLGFPQSVLAEICLLNITKATGIERMMEYLNEDMSSTVAIGDGANDIEMVASSGFGIAMGNGSEGVKLKAKFISTSVEEDGLKNALEMALSFYGCKREE